MSTQPKYKSTTIKSREELGTPLHNSDFKTSRQRAGSLSINGNFIKKDLGNGYFELIPKKKKG